MPRSKLLAQSCSPRTALLWISIVLGVVSIMCWKAFDQMRWPVTTGVVTNAIVHKRSGYKMSKQVYALNLAYEFKIDDKTHTGFDELGYRHHELDAERMADEHKSGTEIYVHYNKANPEESYLKYTVFMAMMPVLLTIGGFALWLGLGEWWAIVRGDSVV